MPKSTLSQRVIVFSMLIAVSAWFAYLHLPTLEPGYLNAGDDHIHVAFANENARIWQSDQPFLGWSTLYGSGAPIFLLRPPGLYWLTGLLHNWPGLSIEQSLKLVVTFGFCLFPFSIFVGCRLLGFSFIASAFSGLFALLPVSLWGHTVDAYQYLGIHKQLLAIFLFPVALGSLFSLIKDGTNGFAFAVTFAAVFLCHPYIAYCVALLAPALLLAVYTGNGNGAPSWQRIFGTILWSITALCLIGVWLIPYLSSSEIQIADPYLSRRNYFDVIGCTTAETLREFFLGGILDTARFAGPFGGSDWLRGNEWGWLDNSRYLRVPIVTSLAVAGLLIVLLRPFTAGRRFAGLAFVTSLIIFIGPDDFPFLDKIPFAKEFQNIHAIFLLEWAAIVLGGVACETFLCRVFNSGSRKRVRVVSLAVSCLVLVGYATAVHERTHVTEQLADLRKFATVNGQMQINPESERSWQDFLPLVEILKKQKGEGSIAAFPHQHDDSVLYNLLPLMVDRSVYLTGFEKIGGVYDILISKFRSELVTNYPLQRLFNIRYVIDSPRYRKNALDWHQQTERLVDNSYWQLARVRGNFSKLESLPLEFIGFIGSEGEWAQLMTYWLKIVKNGETVPWVINLSDSAISENDRKLLHPYLKRVIIGEKRKLPATIDDVEPFYFTSTDKAFANMLNVTWRPHSKVFGLSSVMSFPLVHTIVKNDRNDTTYEIDVGGRQRPVILKSSFYRGWQAEIDQEKQTIFRVSPGLQMVMVPAGTHQLSFKYTGPNNWRWSLISFWTGVALLLSLPWFLRGGGTASSPSSDRRWQFVNYIPVLVSLAVFTILGKQAFSEAYKKIPVMISPAERASFVDGKVVFFWNYVVGVPREKQKFDLQIADNPGFSEVQHSLSTSENSYRIDKIFKGDGPYYYRLRSVVDGKPSEWTKPIMFYGSDRNSLKEG